MSQEKAAQTLAFRTKVDVCQRSYAAFNRRDLEALLELYDPACEWCMANYSGWPEKPVYRGRRGLTEFFETWLEPWEDFWVEPRVLDLPGDRAIVIGVGRGHGKASGAFVELPPLAQVVDFREGRILRVDTYSDVTAGLEAVGLSEQDAHADS